MEWVVYKNTPRPPEGEQGTTCYGSYPSPLLGPDSYRDRGGVAFKNLVSSLTLPSVLEGRASERESKNTRG